jgi:hypothetical protein
MGQEFGTQHIDRRIERQGETGQCGNGVLIVNDLSVGQMSRSCELAQTNFGTLRNLTPESKAARCGPFRAAARRYP